VHDFAEQQQFLGQSSHAGGDLFSHFDGNLQLVEPHHDGDTDGKMSERFAGNEW
jgi:hypothetical protein